VAVGNSCCSDRQGACPSPQPQLENDEHDFRQSSRRRRCSARCCCVSCGRQQHPKVPPGVPSDPRGFSVRVFPVHVHDKLVLSLPHATYAHPRTPSGEKSAPHERTQRNETIAQRLLSLWQLHRSHTHKVPLRPTTRPNPDRTQTHTWSADSPRLSRPRLPRAQHCGEHKSNIPRARARARCPSVLCPADLAPSAVHTSQST
jgi:hypothetical protein